MVVSLLRTILQFELGFAFFWDDQNPYKKSVVKGHHYCLFKGASFHFFSKQKKKKHAQEIRMCRIEMTP